MSEGKTVSARLYAPAGEPLGTAVQIYCTEQDLCAVGHDDVRIPLRDLKPRYGGFNQEQVYFDWLDKHGESWSVSTGKGDAELLMAGVPEALRIAFHDVHARQQKRERRSRYGLGMLAVYLLLPFLLLLVLLWKSHQIAGWIASWISLEQEQQLGEMFFQEETADLKLRQEGADYQVLKDIGTRLTQGSVYQYHWYVSDSPEVNAFAIPGGYVVANTALLKLADSAEELAGVLAHEVQHVEQRHTLENLIYDLGWQAALAMMVGDVSSLWVTQAASDLSGLKFSRELESDADMKGLDALHKAGINPHGMVSFFAKLAQEEGLGIPAFLSTHPTSARRSEILLEAIESRDGWASEELPYDWSKIRAVAGGEP